MTIPSCNGSFGSRNRWAKLQGGWKSCSSTIFDVAHRAGKAHGNADVLSRRPCLGENCKYCTRHEERDQLADTSQKLLAHAARVVGPILPLTADKEFGDLAWSTAQRKDHVIGPMYEWVRVNERPSGE